jgi:hypothetical protein
MTNFCSLKVSISLLGYTPSFLGEFSPDMKVVATSLSFVNVLKACYLVLFPLRKMQNAKCKNRTLLKIFYLISAQQEHFRTKFQLILETTLQGYNFYLLTIFGNCSCDHCPDVLTLAGIIIILILFFITFSSKQVRFHF